MKNSHGNYGCEQTARCCELGGDLAKSLDHVFASNIGGSCPTLPAKASDVVKDVKNMVDELVEEKLFDNKPGRFHRGLEKIRHGWSLQKPSEVAEKIRGHLTTFQLWKEFN